MAELIHQNSRLIWNIVKRFIGRGVETEDLFQIGVLGFIKAIKRFDIHLKLQLSTYAVSMMMGELKRYLRDDGMIKVSRSLKEISTKIKETKEYHFKQYGIELSNTMLSQMLNISYEDIILALEATSVVDSLERVSDTENSSFSLQDTIAEKRNDYEALINQMTIQKALKVLNDRERKIMIYRYYKELTQAKIAKMIGISQVQVSRIEKRALQKLKLVIS